MKEEILKDIAGDDLVIRQEKVVKIIIFLNVDET